jgi:hypothetical protein
MILLSLAHTYACGDLFSTACGEIRVSTSTDTHISTNLLCSDAMKHFIVDRESLGSAPMKAVLPVRSVLPLFIAPNSSLVGYVHFHIHQP